MGLFCLPVKNEEDCTALELVECSERNINLWKENQDCDYLLSTFAINCLEKAAKKINQDKKSET